MTMRTVPPSVAAVLESLELDQPRVVTTENIDTARMNALSRATTAYIIKQLTKSGWLLPLRTRGVWEFAPAARAGRYSAGDPYIELRGTLRKRPLTPVVLAAESAAWLQRLSGRTPRKEVLSAEPGFRISPALNGYRIVRRRRVLDPVLLDELPVWRVSTLIVAMSSRPSAYRDWPNVADWIEQASAQLDRNELQLELGEEPRSTWMRLAYLLDRGSRLDLATDIATNAPEGEGPYYLGPRGHSGSHNATYDVIDSALTAVAS